MALLDLTESDQSTTLSYEPVVDIVCVHGLFEAGLNAWTDPKSRTVWMRDLFPCERYKARILCYEYDPEALFNPGGDAPTTMRDESINLVMEVVTDRTINKATRRPIIFVCHGFGGILVKKALIHSNSRDAMKSGHLRAVARSTYAVIFMATPHYGMSIDTLLLMLGKRKTSPSDLLRTLAEDSEALAEVNDLFLPLMKNFHIYNLWEQRKTEFSKTKCLVVKGESAAPAEWDDVDTCGVYATHSGIVKFRHTRSPGYKLVLAALDRYISGATEGIGRRWGQDMEIGRLQQMHELWHLQDSLGIERSPQISGLTKSLVTEEQKTLNSHAFSETSNPPTSDNAQIVVMTLVLFMAFQQRGRQKISPKNIPAEGEDTIPSIPTPRRENQNPRTLRFGETDLLKL